MHHQVSLGATDTLLSKNLFKCKVVQCGCSIKHYHTNNGIFTKSQFWDAVLSMNQGHTMSGIGMHHQNGLAMHAIKTMQDRTHTMMLHLSMHWPDEYDVCLWPFAMDYAVWLFNHTPQCNSGLAPMEVFCGLHLNCKTLCQAKVFGCPTYILDPKLQDGNKIPKWSLHVHLGQFLGFLHNHSSSIGLIWNLRTNYVVTPQFHVVYNQPFFTVTGGVQQQSLQQLDPNNFQIYLKGKWATDDWVHALADWDPQLNGPLPDNPPNWDVDELALPPPAVSKCFPFSPTLPPYPLHSPHSLAVHFQP